MRREYAYSFSDFERTRPILPSMKHSCAYFSGCSNVNIGSNLRGRSPPSPNHHNTSPAIHHHSTCPGISSERYTIYSILSPWGEDEGRRHVITATVRVYRRGVNNPEPVRNRFRERRLFWRKLGLYIFFSRIFMLITAVQKAEGMIGRLHAEV